jgi:hypothetical protein
LNTPTHQSSFSGRRFLAGGRAAALVVLLFVAPEVVSAAQYFVDCASGDDEATGREAVSAWRSLEKLNQTSFYPGDLIQLKRGTTCSGMLWPKGSGTSASPIGIGAYGTGSLPVVDAKGSSTAIRLFNQHHWEIRDLEVSGSTEYGIHVSGDQGVLDHFRVTDCVVHGVHSTEKMKTKTSGLVVFEATEQQVFQNVVIDGVTAYDTNRWSGIVVSGLGRGQPRTGPRSRNVTIRNSIVNRVYGDGIILFGVQHGLIERSAAWYTGMEPKYSIGTPNSIWTWTCADCIVRETEGFFSDSPGVDGGVYDIDWSNDRNLVENNYGHDSQSYCVAVFGANGVTTASEIRHNVCAGTGRSPRLAMHHGDVHVFTWNKGSVDGLRIHDNTFLWDPPIDSPVLNNEAAFSGNGTNSFENNLVVSRVPWMVRSATALRLNGNRYVHAGVGSWVWNGTALTGFAEYQKASGQDSEGTFSSIEPESHREIQPASVTPDLLNSNLDLQSLKGSYALVSFLNLSSGERDKDDPSRSEAIVLRSAAMQYGAKGLRIIAVAVPASRNARQAAADWNLDGVQVLAGKVTAGNLPITFLLDRDGRMLKRWIGYAPAKEIVFTLRTLLGPPAGVNQ